VEAEAAVAREARAEEKKRGGNKNCNNVNSSKIELHRYCCAKHCGIGQINP
jgi:hypothetical protein